MRWKLLLGLLLPNRKTKSKRWSNVKYPKFRIRRATSVRAIFSAGRGPHALPALRALCGVVEAFVSTATHLGLGSAPGPGAGDRGLAITNLRAIELMKCCDDDAATKSRRRLLPRNLGD
jgi:hypothetical protein